MTAPERSPGTAAASAEAHHHHRDVTGGWLRPAVFGAMDGLVSNLALVSGMAGGGAAAPTLVLAGLAGLAAGAFSMAAGEYTSVASQSELALAEIEIERRELELHPEEELRELAAVYTARGVDPELARAVATQLSRDPHRALDVHVREELGFHLDDLPSPVVAALSSFLCFAAGAALPVLPYLLGATTLVPTLVLSLLGLFLCGVLVSLVTSRTWWYSGSRQLVLGSAAAALTYVVGSVVGVGLG